MVAQMGAKHVEGDFAQLDGNFFSLHKVLKCDTHPCCLGVFNCDINWRRNSASFTIHSPSHLPSITSIDESLHGKAE